jgi:hypothetical protein
MVSKGLEKQFPVGRYDQQVPSVAKKPDGVAAVEVFPAAAK